MSLVLVIILILVIAGLPSWPYSTAWAGAGYWPSGLLGVVLLVLLVLMLMGRI